MAIHCAGSAHHDTQRTHRIREHKMLYGYSWTHNIVNSTYVDVYISRLCHVFFFLQNNVKALFKRGKAHALILNERECHDDFNLAVKIDPSVKAAVNKELAALQKRMKERDEELSKHLKGMF